MIVRLWKVQVSVKRVADILRCSCLIICEMRERERDASPRSSMASSRAARDGSQKKKARSLLKILLQSWDKNETNRES